MMKLKEANIPPKSEILPIMNFHANFNHLRVNSAFHFLYYSSEFSPTFPSLMCGFVTSIRTSISSNTQCGRCTANSSLWVLNMLAY